jgi:hypothetical protein
MDSAWYIVRDNVRDILNTGWQHVRFCTFLNSVACARTCVMTEYPVDRNSACL